MCSAFQKDSYVIISQLTALANARAGVELADEAVTDRTVARAAAHLFAANPNLKFYLLLADRPPRVVAIRCNCAIMSYTAAESLPDELSWSEGLSRLSWRMHYSPGIWMRRRKTRYARLPRCRWMLL